MTIVFLRADFLSDTGSALAVRVQLYLFLLSSTSASLHKRLLSNPPFFLHSQKTTLGPIR